ncbi:uncharacterized protein LOC120001047 isoform X2 [Tripterygium wilfordii]|uniref:uncharacterized protein LOC120001047 isoform X2 n=1 Tax=Tripterygium wilfordii TaxID=458696 RepID=UPI0018F83895|nr:uncharacterized protein LOC120001047 isoform X2 [Tripterygium wilfordii]
MEVEKKRQKGGLLHLFDWNGKSRKKLFSNNPALPEGTKQGTGIPGNMVKLQSNTIGADDNRASSSNKGSSDFSCASSVTSDEGHGTRGPGIVARLMGLDSMPNSNACEPCATPVFDSHMLRSSQYDKSSSGLRREYHSTDYFNIPNNKLEIFQWNHQESRPHKSLKRPTERFRTEMLPSKSAKSIPITHHKLLSPIRSPGFISTKNEAYIVQAAAKMIESSPRAAGKEKLSSIGPSSVPLRIRVLKQKMEAAHTACKRERSNEPNGVKCMNGQGRGKSHGEPRISTARKVSEHCTSDNVMNKVKSVSLAVQAKVNIQKRDGSNWSSNMKPMNQKEGNGDRPKQPLWSQSGRQRTLHNNTSESRTISVLRHNNQKQNRVSNRDSSRSKSSVSNQRGKRTHSMDNSNRMVNKVVLDPENRLREMNCAVTDSTKELSSSKPKNATRKKCPVNADDHIDNSVSNNVLITKDERYVKCNVAIDGCLNEGADNMKQGMDVVSFTFTSPLSKSRPDPQSSSSVSGNTNRCGLGPLSNDDQSPFQDSIFSSSGLNIIGGDVLSVLLEQKLRELSYRVEESSGSALRNPVPMLNVVRTTREEQNRLLQLSFEKDKPGIRDDSGCYTIDDLKLSVNPKWQLEESEDHNNCANSSEDGQELDCLLQSPGQSYSEDTNTASGSKYSSFSQAQEAFDWLSVEDSRQEEGNAELSDSASSKPRAHASGFYKVGAFMPVVFKEANEWELDYVRYVLGSTELSLKDFALGKNPKVIDPDHFNQLENQEIEPDENEEEQSKLCRKLLFDCVSECLDLRCSKVNVGSCKAWIKLSTSFQKKKWLIEEVCKEISSWKSMEDLMIEELVDQDMSSYYGRWLDFDIEAFEEGVEIEKGIFTSLLDEVFGELLHF